MEDPRFKNELPSGGSVSEYMTAYTEQLSGALKTLPPDRLEAALATLKHVIHSGARIYVGGNGGSAAIADHLCCDWTKGTHSKDKPSLRVHSMTANSALFTALSNDFGYEHGLEKQIEMFADDQDVVVLISSSGNSPNVVRAAEAARTRKMTVIGLTGFSGGKLKELADISLHIPVNNYGIVEDAHQIIMHTLAQVLAMQRDGEK